jgi:3,4-dihydroxy 2-butanone 4-phosphate synthase/GTP cyclohydrolase II
MQTIAQALAALAEGRPVVVVDDEDRENEGDLIVAAELVEARTMAFLVRHTSGFVCVALPGAECERLALPPMHHTNRDGFGTAYRVTVDAVVGVTTGISARDRATTARLLASAHTRPADLARPGHVVPLAARAGGVLERAGHTEAAVDLTRLAGLQPAGVLCEIVSTREPGRMARRDELADFATEHGLVMISIADLATYRRATEQRVERAAGTRLPMAAGSVRTIGYRDLGDGREHVALVAGEIGNGHDVPVHAHAECLIGDVFGSLRCGCAHQLDAALREVLAHGRGVVVYLRADGPGILRSLREDDAGVGRLGAAECGPVDPTLLAAMLGDLGVQSVRHLHNPPSVRAALAPALTSGPVSGARGGRARTAAVGHGEVA